MNILYLSADRGIPVRGDKGAAVHIRMMIGAFARAGHMVTLLAPTEGGKQDVDGRVINIPLPELLSFPLGGATEGQTEDEWKEKQTAAYGDVLFAAASDLMKTESFDLIYERYSLWSDVGARLHEETGVPFVLEVNAPLREEAAMYRMLFNDERAAAIEQTQFSTATMISVVSERLREYVIGHGGDESRVQLLPNGVDPIRFHPAVQGRKLLLPKDAIVIGFVGRIRPWHDVETLVFAFAQLHREDRRYHLLLVGRGADEVAIPDDVSAAVLRPGAVPHGEVPSYISAMDVAVSSHVAPSESAASDSWFSPLKLYEYLACGVPTVAADVGQAGQLLTKYEIGWLYEPSNAKTLVDAIRHIVADPKEAKKRAWHGAKVVLEQFTWDANRDAVCAAVGHTPARKQDDMPLFDDKLRQRLYRATRPDLAYELMPYGIRKKWDDIEQIQLLKHKVGRRAVLAYRAGNGRQAVGKLFQDERGERLDQIQRFLWENGFDQRAADQIMVAQAHGYADKMWMQVQGFVPGKTLGEIAETEDITPLMARVGRALAKLHTVVVPDDVPFRMKTWTLKDEIDNLARFYGELQTLCPDKMVRITPLYTTLITQGDALPSLETAVPIHRDFYYSQVMLHRKKTYLIDFDLLTWGDGAVDVGNFVAHLKLLSLLTRGDWDGLDEAAALFLAHYDVPISPKRVKWYHAATLFRLLSVVQTRPQMSAHFDTVLNAVEQQIISGNPNT